MNLIKHRFLIVSVNILTVVGACRCFAGDESELDALLSAENVWSCTVSTFPERYSGLGFSFVEPGRVAKSNSDKLTFQGSKVWECRFYFVKEALSRVELSLYNKGDAGEINQDAFEKMLSELCGTFQKLTGSRGISGKVSNDRPNYYVNRRSWKKNNTAIQAEWAFVNAHRSNRVMHPFRAEFIKVLLTPVREGSISGQPAVRPDWATRVSGRILKENVEHNSAGDIWVTGVPMVDQGQKGYCAAASAERVLRYYGWQGDQHEIAQLADTAAQGGTSLDGMIEAVAVVGKRYQLTDKTLISTGSDRNFEKSEFYNIIKLYNRKAKSASAAEIKYMDFCEILPGNVRMINIMRIYAAFDADLLKSAKIGQKQDYVRFQQNILNYVKQGVPLFWACIVGKYPENPDLGQNGAFGHIRLIIGINQREKELIYSDSWGPRHALKRMPLDNAWAMTFGMTVLKPRDVR